MDYVYDTNSKHLTQTYANIDAVDPLLAEWIEEGMTKIHSIPYSKPRIKEGKYVVRPNGRGPTQHVDIENISDLDYIIDTCMHLIGSLQEQEQAITAFNQRLTLKMYDMIVASDASVSADGLNVVLYSQDGRHQSKISFSTSIKDLTSDRNQALAILDRAVEAIKKKLEAVKATSVIVRDMNTLGGIQKSFKSPLSSSRLTLDTDGHIRSITIIKQLGLKYDVDLKSFDLSNWVTVLNGLRDKLSERMNLSYSKRTEDKKLEGEKRYNGKWKRGYSNYGSITTLPEFSEVKANSRAIENMLVIYPGGTMQQAKDSFKKMFNQPIKYQGGILEADLASNPNARFHVRYLGIGLTPQICLDTQASALALNLDPGDLGRELPLLCDKKKVCKQMDLEGAMFRDYHRLDTKGRLLTGDPKGYSNENNIDYAPPPPPFKHRYWVKGKSKFSSDVLDYHSDALNEVWGMLNPPRRKKRKLAVV